MLDCKLVKSVLLHSPDRTRLLAESSCNFDIEMMEFRKYLPNFIFCLFTRYRVSKPRDAGPERLDEMYLHQKRKPTGRAYFFMKLPYWLPAKHRNDLFILKRGFVIYNNNYDDVRKCRYLPLTHPNVLYVCLNAFNLTKVMTIITIIIVSLSPL